MLRSLLLSLLMILLAYSLRVYVDSFRSTEGKEEVVNILEGVSIRSYSKQDIEWTIKGETMKVVGEDVMLTRAEFSSEEALIRAGQAYLNRSSGKGELSQGVDLLSGELRAKSQKVYMELKEGRLYGDDRIELTEGKNRVKGQGFEIRLKPLQVIINRAGTIIE
ncbi:MAG: hypothetical protein ACK4OF_05710 [Aquificaceae bacterium]